MNVRETPPVADGTSNDIRISMTQDHFQWLLMWHTAMVRSLMLVEIDTNGIDRARRNTTLLDRERRAFIAKHWPEMKMP